MTTYILHGGKTSINNSQNDEFFGYFSKLVEKDEVTVLLCYFSRAKDKWDTLIARDSNTIGKSKQKRINILVAQDVKDLFGKLDKADVLYVAGGEAEFLEPVYPLLSELKNKLIGKVYAGSSMGAFMASEKYVLSLDSQETNSIHSGLGLLPIQILCHWDVETEQKRKLQLLTGASDKPVLVLNECESVIIYK